MNDLRSKVFAVITLALLVGATAEAKTKQHQRTVDDYLKQFPALKVEEQVAVGTPGSLFVPGGELIDLASDYKAARVGDPVMISIVESTTSENSSSVDSSRDFNTLSGISGLPANIPVHGVSTLLGAKSSTALKGSGASASKSQLRTVLTGEVVATLSNGNLVIEVRRSIKMNNQQETVLLRGIARRADLGRNNNLLSTQLSNLELDVSGKGVLSDSTRPPNIIMRTLLRLIGF